MIGLTIGKTTPRGRWRKQQPSQVMQHQRAWQGTDTVAAPGTTGEKDDKIDDWRDETDEKQTRLG